MTRWTNAIVAIGAIISAVCVGYVVYIYAANDVFVTTVKIPSKIASMGIDPALLTRNALYSTPSKIQSFGKTLDAEPIGNPLPDGSCYPRLPIPSDNPVTLVRARLDEIYGNFEIPDYFDTGEPLYRLIKFVRNQLGMPLVEISTYIAEVNGEYVLQVSASRGRDAPVTRSIQIDDISSIEQALTIAFAETLAPEMAALTRKGRSPKNYTVDLQIADQIMKDPARVQIIKMAQFYSLVGDARVGYDHYNFDSSLTQANHLLNEIMKDGDLKAFGSRRDLVLLSIFNFIAYYDIRTKDPGFTPARREWMLAEARKAAANGGPVAQLSLAALYQVLSLDDEAIITVKEANEAALVDESMSPNDLAIFGLGSIPNLVDRGEIAEAKIFLDRLRRKLANNRRDVRDDILAMLDVKTALLLFADGEIGKLSSVLNSELPNRHPCVAFVAFSSVVHSWKNVMNLPEAERNQLVEEMKSSYEKIEASGVSNAQFYNTVGTFYNLVDDPQAAVLMFRRMRDFPGDTVWSYVNEGWTLLKMKDFEAARKAFEASFEHAVIPRGVSGILQTFAEEGRSVELLDVYQTYRENVSEADFFYIFDSYRDSMAKVGSADSKAFERLEFIYSCLKGGWVEVTQEYLDKVKSLGEGKTFDAQACYWH